MAEHKEETNRPTINIIDKREIIEAKWFPLDIITNNGNEEEGP